MIALVISLLVHQLFLALFGEIWPAKEPEPPVRRQEIMLVEAPKPPAPEEQPKEPKAVEKPADIPTPKPGRRASKPPLEPTKVEPEVAEVKPPPIEPWPEQALPPSPEPSERKKGEEVNTELSWRSFEETFEKEAAADREAYEEASLANRRGEGFYGKISKKVEKAMKNNRGWVTPGNQEPLGNRKEIFYAYIYEIHERKVHPLFADGFWHSLSNFTPTHPLNDPALNAWAEFEIMANGDVNEVRLVKTSGNAVFDAASVDSIYRSSPFPAPPDEIMSWNKRVYIRWGFFRSLRKCGVFNVEPYIIKAPDADKEDVSIKEFIEKEG